VLWGLLIGDLQSVEGVAPQGGELGFGMRAEAHRLLRISDPACFTIEPLPEGGSRVDMWASQYVQYFIVLANIVADCLKPLGRVFFADDAYRTSDELVEGPSSPVIRRQLNDGTPYRLVKVPTSQPASKSS
jgi:hypothetical protein